MLSNSLHNHLDESLAELSLLLDEEDWETADRLTADLLLDAVVQNYNDATMLSPEPETGHRPHLTTEALAGLPCPLLHALDDRWQKASGGHFGFSAQLQIYAATLETIDFDPALRNWSTPHPFFEEVGWLMLFPLRPIGFLRFYTWLDFDIEAPRGHLPALWYWRVPRIASLQMGGLLTGQGGAFGDLARLDAMMLRLSRCHQLGG